MGIISKIIGFFSGDGGGSIMLGVMMLALSVHSCNLTQDIDKQAGEIKALTGENALLTAANAGFAAANKELRERQEADNALILQTVQERDSQAAQSRVLAAKLQEALSHEKIAAVTTVLSDPVSDALCLRLQAARGALAAGGDNGAGTGSLHNGAPDTGAAPLAGDCAAWRGRLTVGAVMEWAGALLDHAGAERLDKAALRERNKTLRGYAR